MPASSSEVTQRLGASVNATEGFWAVNPPVITPERANTSKRIKEAFTRRESCLVLGWRTVSDASSAPQYRQRETSGRSMGPPQYGQTGFMSTREFRCTLWSV